MSDALLTGLAAAVAVGALIIAVRFDSAIDFVLAVLFTFLAVWRALRKPEEEA